MKKHGLVIAGILAFSPTIVLAGHHGEAEKEAPKAVAAKAAAAPAKAPVKAKAATHTAKDCIDRSPAVMEYKSGMNIMHRDMNVVYSGDADMDFTAGMVPHHQGAVDMAETLLRYGKDEELKALGKRIIAAQKQEIAMMKHWLFVRGYKAPEPAVAMKGHEHHMMPRYARPEVAEYKAVKEYVAEMEAMHKGMDIQYTGNPDIDFARGMIPHHQGAVEMAVTLKRFGKDRQLSVLADDIIRSQQQEIAWMKKWLEKKTNPVPAK